VHTKPMNWGDLTDLADFREWLDWTSRFEARETEQEWSAVRQESAMPADEWSTPSARHHCRGDGLGISVV
jgi:hypothetical protein